MKRTFWILTIALTIAFALAIAGVATAGTYALAAGETDTPDAAHAAPDTGDSDSTDPVWEHITGKLFGRHEMAMSLDLPDENGVLIAGVEEGSALAKAGVVRGDIILSVDGDDVKGMLEMDQALDKAPSSGSVTLRVQHGDDVKTVKVAADEAGQGIVGLGAAPCGGGLLRMAKLDPTATVVGVEEDGPAAKAGIEEGDRIVALDGKEVATAATLLDALGDHKPGDKVTVRVAAGAGDDAKEREVTITLGKHPDDAARAFMGVMLGHAGVDFVKGMAPMLKAMPGDLANPVVGEVVEDSPAAKAGLEQGDVIVSIDGDKVSTSKDVIAAVAKREPGDTMTLSVRSGDEKEREVRVKLGSRPDDEKAAYLGVQLGMMFTHELPDGVEGIFSGPGTPGGFSIPFGGDGEGSGGLFRFRVPAPGSETAPDQGGTA